FSEDGTLAGGEWNGDIWTCRQGRCPTIHSAQSERPSAQGDPSVGRPGPRAAEPVTKAADRTGGESRPPESPPPDGPRRRSPGWGMGPLGGRNREQCPTSLAFDQGRLVAHDPFGLRVWSPDGIAEQAPPISAHPMPIAPVTWWNTSLLAR